MVAEEEAHRHDFEAVSFDGDDALLLVGFEFLVGDPKHEGEGGAVEVAVEDADFEALLGEGDGEVAGDRGLSDPAFSGGHGDDPFDAGEGGVGGGGGFGFGRVFDFDLNLDFGGIAEDRVEDLVAVLENLLRDFGVAGLDLDFDLGGAVDHFGRFDEAEGNDVT